MKKYNITVNGKVYEVEVEEVGTVTASGTAPVAAPISSAPASATPATSPAPKAKATPAAVPANGAKISAPMPGTILSIAVVNGQKIAKGAVLCVLEAMKMENDIVSPIDGTVSSVNTQKGSSVNSGDMLFIIS